MVANKSEKSNLIMVTKVEYNPLQNRMFYPNSSSTFTRNLYEPSEKFMYPYEKFHIECPEVYKKLFTALAGNEEKGFDYSINEYCEHFQTHAASKKFHIYNGKNTETTDIFYEYVIEYSYGKKNSVKIDDGELDKQFLSRTENKLVVNINKIPSDATDKKEMKKRLEKLVKNKPSYTMIYFTTDELDGIDIYRNSNDYSVFTPSDITKDYLGYGSKSALEEELLKYAEEFAGFMYNWKVDKELMKNSLPTKAKEMVLNAPKNRIDCFIKAIQTKDVSYFESLNNTANTELFTGLREDINKNIISKSSLAPLFNALEDTEFSAKAFLEKLRSSSKMNKIFFDKKNVKGVATGDELYIIDSKYNEFYEESEV